VLLLGPRQHGKTTGLIRVKQRLLKTGLPCALIDLQAMPPCSDYPTLLDWFSRRVGREFGLTQLEVPAASQDLEECLASSIPAGIEPVVLMIDEAAAISDAEIRAAFYGQIRAVANARAEASAGELAARVQFVFAGCFSPEAVIRNSLNSPFNVCERIETEDLTLAQANELRHRVEQVDADPYTQTAYELVGGQPYLLQSVFAHLQASEPQDREDAYREAVESLKNGQDDHLQYSVIDCTKGLPEVAPNSSEMLPDKLPRCFSSCQLTTPTRSYSLRSCAK
jgi:hypothetical protein